MIHGQLASDGVRISGIATANRQQIRTVCRRPRVAQWLHLVVPIALILFVPARIGLASMPSASGARSSISPGAKPVAELYSRLPLVFERNQGQTDPVVKFFARGDGYAIFLTPDEAVLRLLGGAAPRRLAQDVGSVSDKPNANDAILRMRLVGALKDAPVSGESPSSGKTHYYLGHLPAKWRANIPSFEKVRYSGVYPGIDLVYYGNQRQLEYDFIVAPGATPETIRLALSGARHVRVDPSGELVIETAAGLLRWHKPAIYQIMAGRRKFIKGGYQLRGNGLIAFSVSNYDHTRPLIIDPVLIYSTLLGGGGDDFGTGVAVDQYGNIYVTGWTYSADFPVSAKAFQPHHGGSALYMTTDGGAQWTAAGQGLVASNVLSIAFSPSNASVIYAGCDTGVFKSTNGGNTWTPSSTGLPPAPRIHVLIFDPTNPSTIYAGGTGVFKSVDGGNTWSKLWSPQNTYFSPDVHSLIVDPSNPATIYAARDQVYKSTDGGASWSAASSGLLLYYFNSSSLHIDPTSPNRLYVADEGGVYVTTDGANTWQTTNTGLPGPYFNIQDLVLDPANPSILYVHNALNNDQGIYQSTNQGGNWQLVSEALGGEFSFLRLAPTNPTTMYAAAFENYTGITTSTDGGKTWTAVTNGLPTYGFRYFLYNYRNFSSLAVAPNNASTVYAGTDPGETAFVTKFNSSGRLVYSTYLGGSQTDEPDAVAVDTAGNAYVTGTTFSPDFPTTPGAFQTNLAGIGQEGGDAFVTKLDAAGNLVYSTYLGGKSDEAGTGIAVTSNGEAVVTGWTDSPNFPTTSGAYNTTFTWKPVFVTKLNASGTGLVYSTFIGTTIGQFYGPKVALDSAGNVWITGSAYSGFPTTAGAFQTQFGGYTDAFVSKLSSDGSSLLYSTLLGGSGEDHGMGIALDKAGNIFVSGYTASTDFPVTSGAFHTTYGGGYDTFVVKLNPTVSTMEYGTYMGSGWAINSDIAVGPDDEAVIVGSVAGSFPVTPNALQGTVRYGNGFSGYIAKLNTIGSALVYGSYMYGGGEDWCYGVAIDAAGHLFVTGGADFDWPVTANAFQQTYVGSRNAYLTEFQLVALKLQKLTVKPSTVAGGANCVGTITLNGAEPYNGVAIKLTNTNPAATFSNGSNTLNLVIPPGASSANFAMTTLPVSAVTSGTITASGPGKSLTTSLTVRPIGPAALTFNVNPVIGGNNVVAAVQLEAQAAPGPITVTITSSNGAVAHATDAQGNPISSITITKGLSSGAFYILTSAVTSKTQVTFTVTANGISVSKTLTVSP